MTRDGHATLRHCPSHDQTNEPCSPLVLRGVVGCSDVCLRPWTPGMDRSRNRARRRGCDLLGPYLAAGSRRRGSFSSRRCPESALIQTPQIRTARRGARVTRFLRATVCQRPWSTDCRRAPSRPPAAPRPSARPFFGSIDKGGVEVKRLARDRLTRTSAVSHNSSAILVAATLGSADRDARNISRRINAPTCRR